MENETDDALFHLVPVGEENASTGRLLWQQFGMGALSTAKIKLSQMAEQNLIVRKRVGIGTLDYSLYYRSVSE